MKGDWRTEKQNTNNKEFGMSQGAWIIEVWTKMYREEYMECREWKIETIMKYGGCQWHIVSRQSSMENKEWSGQWRTV